jgi:hypothetical protein
MNELGVGVKGQAPLKFDCVGWVLVAEVSNEEPIMIQIIDHHVLFIFLSDSLVSNWNRDHSIYNVNLTLDSGSYVDGGDN